VDDWVIQALMSSLEGKALSTCLLERHDMVSRSSRRVLLSVLPLVFALTPSGCIGQALDEGVQANERTGHASQRLIVGDFDDTYDDDTAGLTNCVELFGRAGACYESVWANGDQLTMTFANQKFSGKTPSDQLDNFYVIAPQTDTP
jgi:hypothetical protein